MVKITYMPFKEIVIHEILEKEPEVFFEDVMRTSIAQNAQIEPSVSWYNEIAFVIGQFPKTDDIVAEELKGVIHYSLVMFTRIPYKEKYALKLGSQDYTARLRKVGNNTILAEVAEYLKEFPKNQNPSRDS